MDCMNGLVQNASESLSMLQITMSNLMISFYTGLFDGRPADHLFMLLFNSIISIVS